MHARVFMPTLQVRELPEDVYYRLQRKAQQEHRSIAQETIVLLRRALDASETHRSRRSEALNRIAQRQIPQVPEFPSSEEVVREDRDR
jgi:plasmid stability protein